MENTSQKPKTSNPVALLILIPSLVLAILAIALGIVGFGLIPLLPALAGIILVITSIFIFKGSYRIFSRTIIIISAIAALLSVFRGVVLKTKVSDDKAFETTVEKTQQGIDNDLNDAFGGKEVKDSI